MIKANSIEKLLKVKAIEKLLKEDEENNVDRLLYENNNLGEYVYIVYKTGFIQKVDVTANSYASTIITLIEKVYF